MASNDIKRSFNKAFNLELPFALKFHNSHNSPELWSSWLKEKIALTNSWRNINTNKWKLSPYKIQFNNAKQDKTTVACPKF